MSREFEQYTDKIRSGLSYQSSNPGQVSLHFVLC